MNVISQPDNLPLSYSHKPSFCFNISFPFSPAARTIRYYRSIGFHPNQKEEIRYVWSSPRGSPPVAWQWPVRWLQHYKVTRTPSCFCLYWVMTFWRGTPGGTNKSVLPIHSSNVVYPCGLQRVCVCVSVCLSTPFRHPNYLPPPREFDAKMCAVKWDSVGECVSSTSLALARRGQRRMITPNRLHFFPVRVCAERSVTPPT